MIVLNAEQHYQLFLQFNWGIIDLNEFLEKILIESTIFNFPSSCTRQVTCSGYQSSAPTIQQTQSNYFQLCSHVIETTKKLKSNQRMTIKLILVVEQTIMLRLNI
jgi:hypothetical protein